MTPIELKDAVKNDKGELEFERSVIVVKTDKTTEVISEAEYLKKVQKWSSIDSIPGGRS